MGGSQGLGLRSRDRRSLQLGDGMKKPLFWGEAAHLPGRQHPGELQGGRGLAHPGRAAGRLAEGHAALQGRGCTVSKSTKELCNEAIATYYQIRHLVPCPSCQNTGWVSGGIIDPIKMYHVPSTCHDCGGSGWAWDNKILVETNGPLPGRQLAEIYAGRFT